MRLPRRRIRTTRRLARPGRPAPPTGVHRQDSPIDLDVSSMLEDRPRPPAPELRSQESTVEMISVREELALAPSASRDAIHIEPAPPQKMEFTCACGARLIATVETYDKHSRCALCQTVMLLSLVYDGDRRSFEIVPFRVNPQTGP
jgi:hypothetical protein